LTALPFLGFDARMDPYWQLALTSGLGAALITVIAMHLALIPWRKSADAHWTERAQPRPPSWLGPAGRSCSFRAPCLPG
jgi:hypothetical protein